MENFTVLIVFFNLKKGINAEDYGTFAKIIDSPTIKKLSANKSFTILKVLHLFGTDISSPYQYIEITSFEELTEDIKQESVQNMLAMFMEFAAPPTNSYK
jgi:hypothetical protein